MSKPVLTIFYQFNPWQTSIGGIQSIIRSFIKYSPSEFEIRLVGTQNEPSHSLGQWQEAELAGKAIRFMPVLTLQNDNQKHLIPTTVKYTAALWGRYIASDFMHFHRLEPTLATLNWRGQKTLFIHNDIRQQIQGTGHKDGILWQRFPALYRKIERLLIGQFEQILSCNSESVAYYQESYAELADRVSYIKNTFDEEICYPLTVEERQQKRRRLAERLNLPEETKFLLFAGRLHAQKDPLLLIRSIAAMNDKNIHLLVVGDGDLQGKISSEIVNLGLSEQVTMLGSVCQSEVAQLMRVCNVFVLTSAYEGLPIVVLEALACGTPVVTTRCGETPNLLGAGSGFVSQERTPTAIADALRQVLQHPEDYPIKACVETAKPFSAHHVVSDVYSKMWERWQQKSQFEQKNSTTYYEVSV
ncbi:MAG TPA: glycoside hydrolase [Cyanobacteria bacterium UBA11162]|nr:glycoside hydrolase [Cyanobacteria bacterium UBA11162]